MKTCSALVLLVALAASPALAQYTVALAPPPAEKTITVHTTDLYYAPWDWDDLNDATVWYALGKEHADLQAFVMDEPFQGWTGSISSRGDGRTWQGIYNIAVGMDVPYYSGLPNFLSGPGDDGQSQPVFHHAGRDAILDVMANSPDHSVMLHAVGSMRDIAAAYNHDPALFAQKVNRVYTSGGREGDYRDANWGSDPQAVIGLLQSGVPMYVAFCGEGSQHDGSYWSLNIPNLVNLTDSVNPKLSQVVHWGYYGAMDGGYRSVHGIPFPDRPFLPDGIKPPDQFLGNNTMANPQAFFDEPTIPAIDAEIRSGGLTKAMWSPICFLDSLGLRVFEQGTQVMLSYNDVEPGWERVCFFRPATYTLNPGTFDFHYTPCAEEDATIHMFNWETTTKAQYQGIMDAVYRKLVETYLTTVEPPEEPSLEYEVKWLGNGKYGITFTVRGNDGQQKSFFVNLTFEGANGGEIQQILAFGTSSVDSDDLAALYDPVPEADYDMDLDSYFLQPFPDNDMDISEGVNSYHIEAGTGGASDYLDVGLAYIVCTGDVYYDGVISRSLVNYNRSGTAEMPVPGDANLDDVVDGADYTAWADHYSQTDMGWEEADFNGDDVVDGADYTVWADFYGQTGSSPAPEPATAALMALGLVALLRRRRR